MAWQNLQVEILEEFADIQRHVYSDRMLVRITAWYTRQLEHNRNSYWRNRPERLQRFRERRQNWTPAQRAHHRRKQKERLKQIDAELRAARKKAGS